ncbi:MAG TPA: amino acid adenylation domain-containing protein, partial [Thermoanaerobaculia bacterium]|nr:amino acid adenylation domain-containing protein [Thermoanaerobaculia bacterium]
MTTLQLLSHLRDLGVQLWAEDERLRFTAPQGALTGDLRNELAGRKQEILRLLRQGQAGGLASTPVRMPDEVAAAGRFPLSFAQQRLWFLQQLDPASAAYNISRAMLLAGPVRVDLLERSLGEVVRRHAILRTTFAAAGGEPFQVIAPATGWRLPLVDLRDLPAAARWAEMQRLSSLLGEEPMDLARGPLLRVVLLRLEAEEHVAAATLHHIISDAWSTGLLFREMGVVYGAFAQGMLSPLPELPIQYADYAWWQRRHLEGEVLERQIEYWMQQLASAPEMLELPTDRPRSAARSSRGGRLGSLIPRELLEPLRTLGQEEGAATLFMVLLAGFDALLYRCSGQEDIVVGFPIANRSHTELEGLIGLFINTLAMRTRLAGGLSWRQLLVQVRQTTLDAYAHQDLPFERIVEELRPERQLSQTPIFQVTFSLQNTPGSDMQVGPFRMSLLPPVDKTAQFDLTCDIKETAEGAQISWRYREELFDEPTVARLSEHYLNLLAGVAAHPDRSLADLVLLSTAERHQLLAEWSEIPAPALPDLPLHALFEEQAARRPEAPAVEWDRGRLSYGELDLRAGRLARHLRGLGVRLEVPVAFCLERSPEAVVTILAILKAGGAYVPLDPAAPMERLAWLLDDVGAPVLVTTVDLLERLPRTLAITVVLDELADLEGEGEEGDPEISVGADSLAYLMYTSGSTGTPKGVAVLHRAVGRLVRCGDFAHFGPEQAWAQLAPLSFDASTLEIWGALLHGGRLVLMPELPDPAGLGEALARHRVTSLWLTAGLFHQMVEENPAGLAPLSQLLAGGDVLSPEHVRRALAAHPGLRLVNGYGPTENTTFTCCGPLSEPGEVGWTVALGRPIGRTRVHVLDASFQPVPIGVEGELYAGGNGLARGYHGRPDLTAERFVPDIWGTGDRLYRTGDRARYLADGRLEFLGRRDRQVKIRGFRVEPREVEAALARHPGLREAVVEALSDATGGRRLVAWVVPRGSEVVDTLDTGDLRRFLAETLPVYLLPAAFVVLPE